MDNIHETFQVKKNLVEKNTNVFLHNRLIMLNLIELMKTVVTTSLKMQSEID